MGIHIKKLAITTGAAGSTQDFTWSGIGTPVGALFFLSSSITDNQDAAHGLQTFGALANSKQRCLSIACENGVNTSNSWTKFVNDAAVISQDANTGAITGAATATFITDGVRLTIQDQFPAAYFVTVVVFVGGWNVDLVEFDTAASTTVTFGFRPDIGFCALTDGTLHGASTGYSSTSGQATANFSWGMFADHDGVLGPGTEFESAIGFYYEDNIASGSGASASSGSMFQNNSLGFNADPIGFGAGIDILSITSTGLTISDTGGGATIGWILAIDFQGTRNYNLQVFSFPTTNTNPHDVTTPFDPKFVFEFSGHATSVSSLRSDYGTSFSLGFLGEDTPDDYALGVRAWTNSSSSSPSIAGAWQVQNKLTAHRAPSDVLDTSVPIADAVRGLTPVLGTLKYSRNFSVTDGEAHPCASLVISAEITGPAKPVLFYLHREQQV